MSEDEILSVTKKDIEAFFDRLDFILEKHPTIVLSEKFAIISVKADDDIQVGCANLLPEELGVLLASLSEILKDPDKKNLTVIRAKDEPLQ